VTHGAMVRSVDEQPTTAKRVAVIGAGAGGIAAAKYMISAGFDVTVFETGSHIGGLWVYENDNGRAQAYNRLTIISSRRYTRFSDYDFDEETPRFPMHWDMARYLNGYAEHFGVKERVRFLTPVEAVEPAFVPGQDASCWNVRTRDGVEQFDAVLVATGHLNEPRHIDEYVSAFEGDYLHSSQYRYPDPFVGKRICVVGVGNSGVDIASEVCYVAKRTVLVARSGAIIQPKVLFGTPFTDIGLALRKWWIPYKVRARLLSWVVYTAHGDLSRFGIAKPTAKTHPTLSEAVVSHMEYNRITAKPGIKAIAGKRITFADGTAEEFDVLFGATGYDVHLPFLAPEIVPVDGNRVNLYRRIFVPDWPGLCFVGMLNPISTLNRIFEGQSKMLVQYISGEIALPAAEEMREEIREKNAANDRTYVSSARHEMEEPDIGYLESLEQLVADGTVRRHHGGRIPWWLGSPRGRRMLLKMRRRLPS
jgi:dimethylaniline monooxygenase (N-oxide forming)